MTTDECIEEAEAWATSLGSHNSRENNYMYAQASLAWSQLALAKFEQERSADSGH